MNLHETLKLQNHLKLVVPPFGILACLLCFGLGAARSDVVATSTETPLWAVRLRLPHEQHNPQHDDHIQELPPDWPASEEVLCARYSSLAQRLASSESLTNLGQIGDLPGYYLFTCGNKVQCRREDVSQALAHNPGVTWFEEQGMLGRSKRSVRMEEHGDDFLEVTPKWLTFNDPKYSKQWHLHNLRTPGMDLNLQAVWAQGVTGRGAVLAVIDDGIQHSLAEMQDNYFPEGSWDVLDEDPDPSPDHGKDNGHGTRCACELVALANNSICGVGIAFDGRVSGVRLLGGRLTDHMEATAFGKHNQMNQVYSCSWGPDDDGKTIDGPRTLGQAALRRGVLVGRGGWGSIYIVASGNGARNGDDCNFDGYANSIYTATIGAVDEHGDVPDYAEPCSSLLAAGFSSGGLGNRGIATCEVGSGCTEGHSGTSAAAPHATGLLGLALGVRPCLGWRDAQNLLVYTARPVVGDVNAAGFTHNPFHGFGLLDAWRLVTTALLWPLVPPLRSYSSPRIVDHRLIPHLPGTFRSSYNVSAPSDLLRTLEHVTISVRLVHGRRGNLRLSLRCPSGTVSYLGGPRPLDAAADLDWTFGTVRCWGEEPSGMFTLEVQDTASEPQGHFLSWSFVLYGSEMKPEDVMERRRLVERAEQGVLNVSAALPCPPQRFFPPDTQLPTPSTIKLLVLLGCLAFAWAAYAILETALCPEEKPQDVEEDQSPSCWTSSFSSLSCWRSGSRRTSLTAEFGNDEVTPLVAPSRADESPEWHP
uniref:proprotein convertase subtilisin/kexin type 7-like isoform X2 n=1 Tax=Myxine glutinosa TaxID=7769 RepID=UPI00358EFF79